MEAAQPVGRRPDREGGSLRWEWLLAQVFIVETHLVVLPALGVVTEQQIGEGKVPQRVEFDPAPHHAPDTGVLPRAEER